MMYRPETLPAQEIIADAQKRCADEVPDRGWILVKASALEDAIMDALKSRLTH